MSEEALLVLKMVQEGKITPEQGVAFLEALKNTSGPSPASNTSSGFSYSAGSDSSADGAPWGSVSQMQRKLAELQQRLAEMQAKLGAAQAGSTPNSSGSIKLPFGMGAFNLTEILDDAVKGVSALKTEAVISAKKAARQAQKEARKFRQEADKFGKNIHVEVFVSTDGRPKNAAGLPEANRKDEQTLDMPEGRAVSVHNPFGDIKIAGTSADGKIHVAVEKTVWAQTTEEREDALGKVTLTDSIDSQGSKCDISVIAPDNVDGHIAVRLVIQVPPDTIVDAETTYGQIHCESLGRGVRRIESQSGAIDLVQIEAPEGTAAQGSVETRSGTITITRWRGGPLSLTSLSGDVCLADITSPGVRVKSHSGDTEIKASEFTGDYRIETVSGDLNLTNIKAAGKCDLKTQSGAIQVGSITAGNLSVETVSGDMDATDIGCPDGQAGIKSISGDIETRNLSAKDINLTTTSGDVKMGLISDFAGSITGVTVSGDLEFVLPANYQARLTMTTHSGHLQSDFPINSKEGGDEQRYISGVIGADTAPSISLTLQSVSGDLFLKKQA